MDKVLQYVFERLAHKLSSHLKVSLHVLQDFQTTKNKGIIDSKNCPGVS